MGVIPFQTKELLKIKLTLVKSGLDIRRIILSYSLNAFSFLFLYMTFKAQKASVIKKWYSRTHIE